jgi:uridylate kinase
VIATKEGINVEFIRGFAHLLAKMKGMKFVVVTGGGYPSKLCIESIRGFVRDEFMLDQIGIKFTTINALVVKSLFEGFVDTHPKIVDSFDELQVAIRTSKIVIMPGLFPGITTDAVAALACEAVGSKILINVGKHEYVYTKDPDLKGARELKSLTHDALIRLASKSDERKARTNFIFDSVASKLAKRSKIQIRFVNHEIKNLENAIKGRPHEGTTVG